MVAKVHTQIEGFDYKEIFSPIAKIVLVRTLLVVASIKRWFIYQMSVSNVFPRIDLSEKIYMTSALGMLPNIDNRVCRLKQPMYGLKQVNMNWFQKLTTSLYLIGFTQSHVDYNLFYKIKNTSYTRQLNVHDLVILDDDESEISLLKPHLHTQFHIKDLGKLKYFLSIEVSHSTQSIFISQRKYVLDILHKFGQLGTSQSSIPMKHQTS